MNHLLRRSAAPAMTCLFTSSIYQRKTQCDTNANANTYVVNVQPPNNVNGKDTPPSTPVPMSTNSNQSQSHDLLLQSKQPTVTQTVVDSNEKQHQLGEGQRGGKKRENDLVQVKNNDNKAEEKEPTYQNLFPLRQLWKPNVEYPLWDENWDERKMEDTGNDEKDRDMKRFVRKHGVTRHIILIRHGQYDETHKEDEKRLLTPLGRTQAELTGQRLAKMIKGFDEKFGPCNIKTIRVSNMTRAKETAELIAKSLPESVVRAEPDANLNEGRPCHHIPGGRVSQRSIKITDEGHDRIEKAFKTYFYRSNPPSMEGENEENEEFSKSTANPELVDEDKDKIGSLQPHPQHEFEIIVCHANVIRYFLCRALQIPPEAWLRFCTFNCSLTYLTVRPTGTVSCRMLGDIGHLGYEHSTFSMHHGFNW